MQKSEGILSLLIEHAEKIDSRFAAKDYQYEKMKEKRESIVECFSYLDLCEESCELSYVQCLWSFRQYLRDVGKQLQINEQLAHLPSTPLQTPQNALLKLQQHLIGGFIADLTNPVHEKSDLNIDFKADVPDEWLMQWKFAMQWEGKSDPKQGNYEGSFQMKADLATTTDSIPQIMQGSASFDFKLLNNQKLYLAIHDIDFTTKEIDIQTELAKVVMNGMLEKLQGKYIELPLDSATSMSANPFNLGWVKKLIDTPMIDFYHQEDDNTYFGMPSYTTCDMTMMWGVSQPSYGNQISNDCKSSYDIKRLETQGKGNVVLKTDWSNYNLSWSDKYAKDNWPEKFILNKTLVERNDEKIIKIDIPLSESQIDSINYENNQLKIFSKDKYAHTEFQAVLGKNRLTGAWKAVVDGKKVVFAIDYQWGMAENMKLIMTLHEWDKLLLTMTMKSKNSKNYIDGFTLTPPSNVITLEQLQKELSSLPLWDY